MPYEINETHDPNLKSWVESANDPGSDFPLQNLPIAHLDFSAPQRPRLHRTTGIILGDVFVDVGVLAEAGLISDATNQFGFRAFMLEGNSTTWSQLRKQLIRLFKSDNPLLRDNEPLRKLAILPWSAGKLRRPHVSNYTDFYASIHHARTVGAMFRPDNALLPNYKHVPIGYHGRASSIVASGTEIKRPLGQQSPPDDNPGAGPSFGPCKMLDYELELGFFVGAGNELGQPIPIGQAEDHIFGVCLVNDWSARDMQKWEYQPLGPFLAKNFATSISPYVVTMEALAPFRAPAYARPAEDPRPLPYLYDERDQKQGGLDVKLEVFLATKQMRDRGMSPVKLSSGSTKDLYWTPAQMLAHHTSNGCNMQSGDLFASGTVSGEAPASRGCLLELTWDANGKPRKPIALPSGETRIFLQDGDEVIFKGYCEREGFRRIGLGECRGIIAPASPM